MGWPLPGENQKLALWTCSSVGQSSGLIIRRSGDHAPPGPPAILTGEMIYPVDVGGGVRVL